jgi:hypothetical protein
VLTRVSLTGSELNDSEWSGHVQQGVVRAYLVVLGSLQ